MVHTRDHPLDVAPADYVNVVSRGIRQNLAEACRHKPIPGTLMIARYSGPEARPPRSRRVMTTMVVLLMASAV